MSNVDDGDDGRGKNELESWASKKKERNNSDIEDNKKIS